MAKNQEGKNGNKKMIVVLVAIILILLGGLALLTFTDYVPESALTQKIKDIIPVKTGDTTTEKTSDKKTKLDFYVMSQCPYGTQVEDAIAPLMQKMGDVVDLNIDYILYPAKNYEGQEENYCIDSLCSMHGTPEVKGDIVQLCVNKIAPKNAIEFIACQNKDVGSISDNWEDCADTLKLNKKKIQDCYEGEEGKQLLQESSDRSVAINAQGSPTIYFNDKQYQGGRTELDFQRAICQSINNEHKECEGLPVCATDMDCTAETDKIGKCVNPGEVNAECEYKEPQKISLTVLADKRCTKNECDTSAVLGQIQQAFKGVSDIKEMDYNSEEGKALYDDNALEFVPAYLFGKEVETAYFFNDLQNYLVKKGDYYELAVGSTFNPTKEICDNEIDDTENGLIDCADTDCKEDMLCREEVKGKLDLFVMSHCPYGTMALSAMPAVLDAFGDEIDFSINYIATEVESGQFNSLHGQPEVDENIRELCVMKNYPTDYQYMDYIVCRNQDINSTEWEGCAEENSMDVAKIKTCSEGEEGINLLSENIKMGNALQIGASPTWLANNKYQFSGVDAATVQTEICKYNSELKGCSVDLSGDSETANVPAGSCN